MPDNNSSITNIKYGTIHKRSAGFNKNPKYRDATTQISTVTMNNLIAITGIQIKYLQQQSTINNRKNRLCNTHTVAYMELASNWTSPRDI